MTRHIPNFADSQVDVKAKDNDGETALHRASSGGHNDVIETLLQAGADVATKNPKDGAVALHRAASNGHLLVVNTLLSTGADVGAQDSNAWTALHWAAWHGHSEVVEGLLTAGADVASQGDDGRTALHWAEFRGHDSIVEILLHAGEDCDAGIALQWAASKGYSGVVERLLRAGADVAMQSNDGGTALYRAAAAGHEDVVEILLRNGADVTIQSEDGGTALQRAAWHGHLSVAERLLRGGSDVSVMNDDGWTALHFSAYAGHYQIAYLLNQYLASTNQREFSQFAAPIEDAIAFLVYLNSLYPKDSILQRALGNEFLRRKMYTEAKYSFNRSVRIAMENSGASRITDVEYRRIRCDECGKGLRGKHYKCTICPWNYDMCEHCFAAHLHPSQDSIIIPSEEFETEN